MECKACERRYFDINVFYFRRMIDFLITKIKRVLILW